MLSLHKHNKITYEKLIQLFAFNNRVAVVQPTGTGKSFIVLKLIEDNPQHKFLIGPPSIYIFSHFQKHAENSGVSFENVDFISYSKLATLDKGEIKNFKYDYIVLDEFHRCGAVERRKGVNTLLSCLPKTKVFSSHLLS